MIPADFKPMMAAHDAKIERRKDLLALCAKAAIVAGAIAYLLAVNL